MDAAQKISEIQAARAARAEALKAEKSAVAALRRAYAWPRCGEGFPATSAEKKAGAVLVTLYGSIEAACEQLEVFS